MVLDVKAMEWAAENGIDTAKLKAAKIPIYGKWYFPDMPGRVPVVNLQNGHIETFAAGMRAGETLYVVRDDLRRARLGPYAALADRPPAAEGAVAVAGAEPAIASEAPAVAREVEPLPPGIHLPSNSIFPLVLGLGISIALLGLVTGPWPVRIIVTLLGIIYCIVGGIGWAIENQKDRAALEGATEHGHS